MAKVIMIQGTMSNAGKSILVGALCRIFSQDGYKCAPFKSQNMALNSFITEEGLEMGRAQVMQAEAAGIKPSVNMNPILLKPTCDTGSQVIVNGEVTGVMTAAQYYSRKKDYIPAILKAYHKLAEEYDIIVAEGAGSPAEINLKQDDIVNMGLAKLLDAPVLLVGDIDRGGVFAQLVGTLTLLEEDERRRVRAAIINKFRGDLDILKPGLAMLEEKTGVPVWGVIPYFHLDIEDEDSLTERLSPTGAKGVLDIVVIRLPRISNFTDFMALECMEGVTVRYVSSPREFGNPDCVIVPGTKNTIEDLLWMRQNGLEAKIVRLAGTLKPVIGICGGYQMLGEEIRDSFGIEHKGSVKGLGLLPVTTVFEQEKTRTRVRGRFESLEGIYGCLNGVEIEGYEIHMGATQFIETKLNGFGNEEKKPILVLEDALEGGSGRALPKGDGAARGNVFGCYVHGLFDRPEAAQAFAALLLEQKGLDKSALRSVDLAAHKEEQYDKLAQIVRENLDIKAIYEILNL